MTVAALPLHLTGLAGQPASLHLTCIHLVPTKSSAQSSSIAGKRVLSALLCAAYAGYTVVAGNFPGSQAQYDVLLKRQLAGISDKDRAAAAAIAIPIAEEILRDK
jgi:hypothetical protein